MTKSDAPPAAPPPPERPQCIIDRNVLNADTVGNLEDMGLSVFAPLCGRNRGAFVLDPPDGHTYSCIHFPKDFAKQAGVPKGIPIQDSNAIKEQFVGGNITASNAVDLIDLLTTAVYESSANVDATPYGCDVTGMATLQCPAARNKQRSPVIDNMDNPIRAVTTAGLFVPTPWATGHKQSSSSSSSSSNNNKALTLDQARDFYTQQDFDDMAALGLNTVHIPVPLSIFARRYASDDDMLSFLKDILSVASNSKLYVILDLVGSEDAATYTAAATFAEKHATPIIGLVLPSKATDVLDATRQGSSTMALFLPTNAGELPYLNVRDEYMYAAMSMDHTTVIADIASSNSEDDRMKLFYHEATACIARSPLEYATCYRDMPVLVTSGFDLSIDNCVLQGTEKFRDYGQCDRLNETIGSGWWERHRASYAARQLFAFEQGAGWSFAAWKLYDDDNSGVLDRPEKLLALKNVVEAGLFPSLLGHQHHNSQQLAEACLNPPEPDFKLGDKTLAPTPAPPPDCGNGWWNFNTSQCDYWIPPTPAPTKACPVCEDCSDVCAQPLTVKALATGGIAGVLVAAAVLMLGNKLCGRRGYETIPDSEQA